MHLIPTIPEELAEENVAPIKVLIVGCRNTVASAISTTMHKNNEHLGGCG